MNKKKILVFGLSDRVGGVETFYFSYYRKLDKNKYQIDFVSKYGVVYGSEEIKQNGGKTYSIPTLKSNPIKHYSDLNKIYKEGNYDIVHANHSSISNIMHLKLAKKHKVKKIIIHSHNCGYQTNLFFRICHNINKIRIKYICTHFLACTKDAGKWLFGSNYPVTVLNNALDIDKFRYNQNDRDEIRKQLKIKDEVVIGHVGRMCYQKNQEFLVRVFKEYNNLNKNSKLILIGTGKDEDMIKDLIKELDLESNVIIIHSDECYKYYSAFDIFAFPSRYEGLGIVGIEAQINGLPCLFSDVIPKDIKINDNTQFLSINNTKEWIDSLNSKKLKRVNKINSRINKYDINKEAKKLDKIYQGD